MKKFLYPLLIIPLTGCLTADSIEISEWSPPTNICTLEMPISKKKAEADFGIARLSQLVIRAPYDNRAFQVLRADGTLAADPYNHFAASPAQLLKGPILDGLAASPRFTTVVGSSSSAAVSHIIEVTVTRLRLNCSTEGSRHADVELSLLVLDRDRRIVWAGHGNGFIDAEDGNYAKAFSEALKNALVVAMGGK